jgi:DNA-binding transcriptional ArsR family regulator
MDTSQLDATFAALADPTRRAILARLAAGEATVSELAQPLDMSLPAVSKHLGVLERAGLVSRRRSAQFRPCRLEPAPLEAAADWLARYQAFWDESLDRLAQHVESSAWSAETQSKEAPSAASPRSSSGAASPPLPAPSSRPGPSRRTSRTGSGRTEPKS